MKFFSVRSFSVLPASNLLESLLQKYAPFLLFLSELEFEDPAPMSGINFQIASAVGAVNFGDRQHGASDEEGLNQGAAHGLVRCGKLQVIH